MEPSGKTSRLTSGTMTVLPPPGIRGSSAQEYASSGESLFPSRASTTGGLKRMFTISGCGISNDSPCAPPGCQESFKVLPPPSVIAVAPGQTLPACRLEAQFASFCDIGRAAFRVHRAATRIAVTIQNQVLCPVEGLGAHLHHAGVQRQKLVVRQRPPVVGNSAKACSTPCRNAVGVKLRFGDDGSSSSNVVAFGHSKSPDVEACPPSPPNRHRSRANSARAPTWQNSIATNCTPIADVMFHKREKNLVIATRGKPFWVFDDLPLLYRLDPKQAS